MQLLTTRRLDLVPLDLARDLDDLHMMFEDPRWASAGYTERSRSRRDTLARLEREFGDNGGWTWVLRIRPAETAVGVIGVFSDQGTPIRGISWYMRRDHWSKGLMGEAARTVVDHLLNQPGIAGIEAWIDSRNARSIGVARRAGLDLRGRLPRVYDTEIAQSVVMTRAAAASDPTVLSVHPTLMVRDMASTLELLVGMLQMHIHFKLGEPRPHFARIGFEHWSGGSGIDIMQSDDAITPISIGIDVSVLVDPLYDAAQAAGLTASIPPADRPWHRRDFTLVLVEGHRLIISGPTRPPRLHPN